MEVIANYRADQLVFVDESYVDNRDLRRLTGWSKKGTPASVPAPFQKGARYVSTPSLIISFVSLMSHAT